MRRFGTAACLISGYLVLRCLSVFGQETGINFEVASVRPAQRQQNVGAGRISIRGFEPMAASNPNPERITFPDMPLKTIILMAYGIEDYQLSGPGWLDSERYDISAKAPAGATDEQLHVMLQNLLAERFTLAVHHEARVMAVYELRVGQHGAKLKDAAPAVSPPAIEPGERPPTIGVPDKDGFPQIPPGRPISLGHWADGLMHWTYRSWPLSNLAYFLGRELRRPVVDKTEMTAAYDFTLAYARPPMRALTSGTPAPVHDEPSGGPSLQSAVQDQLGLKLESAKDPIDFLVIDHVEKVPTEN